MKRHSIRVEAEVDVDIDEFDTKDIIDYMESLGYTVVKGDLPALVMPAQNLKDVELQEVISEAQSRFGYMLTEFLRAIIQSPGLLKLVKHY